MWTSKVPGKEMAHDSLVLFRFRLASGATIALSSRRVWIHVKAGVKYVVRSLGYINTWAFSIVRFLPFSLL